MSRAVNIYVKKQLRLDLLNFPQRHMYDLGQIGLQSIKARVAAVRDANDQPAPPLKSKIWIRIKKAKGLRTVRDLRGTGMMFTGNIARYRGRTLKRRSVLKVVGHLMDQILVRRVSDNIVKIDEPSTDAGRIKARGNRSMLLFSPRDERAVRAAAKGMLHRMVAWRVKS